MNGFSDDKSQTIRFQSPKTGSQKPVPAPCWVPFTVSGIVPRPVNAGRGFFRDSARAERDTGPALEPTPAVRDASDGSGKIQCLRFNTDGKRAWHGAAYTSGRRCGVNHNPVAGHSSRRPQLESPAKNSPGRDKSVRSAESTVATVHSGRTPADEMGRVGPTKKSPQVSLLNHSGAVSSRKASRREKPAMRMLSERKNLAMRMTLAADTAQEENGKNFPVAVLYMRRANMFKRPVAATERQPGQHCCANRSGYRSGSPATGLRKR